MSVRFLPRARRAGVLLSVVVGLILAAASVPAEAAIRRVAKCPACAQEAANVSRLADLVEERRREADFSLKELRRGLDERRVTSAVVREALEAGDRERYAKALADLSNALAELVEATNRLTVCEAQKCAAPGDPRQAAIGVPFTPGMTITPGMTLAQRPASCAACATLASRRNELALLFNNNQAVLQSVNTAIDDVRKRRASREPDGVDRRVYIDRLLREEAELSRPAIAAQNRRKALIEQFQQADAALTECEQRLCRAPAPRFEVQVFGGVSYQGGSLRQTGRDDFFGPGAALVDARSSDAARGVAPALGAFGRFYFDDVLPDLQAPNTAEGKLGLFVTAGVIATLQGARGFDALGINTVPAGEVRTERSGQFIAPLMLGVRKRFDAWDIPLIAEAMAGVAIGHETVRVNLLREGGAPGGPGASGESSGLYVDPVVGFGLSAPVTAIEGLGPLRIGVMGLAVIGTGSRSVTVQSPNFPSQSYTGEHRRRIQLFFGATLGIPIN